MCAYINAQPVFIFSLVYESKMPKLNTNCISFDNNNQIDIFNIRYIIMAKYLDFAYCLCISFT